MLLAGLSGWLLFSFMDADSLSSWGWRLPFIFGMLIGPVGLWIRAKMDDTPEFQQAEKSESSSLISVFRDHFGRILVVAMCVGVATMSVYLATYLPSFAMQLGLPDWSGYAGAVLAGGATFVLSPFMGMLADKVGQTRIIMTAAVVGSVLVLGLTQLIISTGEVWALLLTELIVGVLIACNFGPLPSLMTQLFPVQVRTTGLSISYNLGVISMGGFAPAILTAWTASTLLGPAFYYAIVAMVSVFGLVLARRVFDQP